MGNKAGGRKARERKGALKDQTKGGRRELRCMKLLTKDTDAPGVFSDLDPIANSGMDIISSI